MATDRSVELAAVFDCSLREGGLDEFEPEPEAEADRGGLWLRVAAPTVADVQRWDPYVAPVRSRSWPLLMTVVVVAAAIAGGGLSWAGGGLSWIGLQTNDEPPVPPAPRAASASIASTEPDTAPAAAAPPVLEPAVSPPSPARVEPPTPTAALSPEAAPVPAAPVAVEPAFERTLAAVSHSYRTLDAATLTTVWPGADTASLSQAFSTLKYQTLSFDRCQMRPNGDASAVASCDVSIAAAPNWGDQALQRRRESWTLVMNRSGDRWTIAGVSKR